MSTTTIKPNGNIVDYKSGSTTATHTKSSGNWLSLMIINDSTTTSLTITVNSMTMTIKAGEVFDDVFVDFNTVTVTTTVAYRLWLRG